MSDTKENSESNVEETSEPLYAMQPLTRFSDHAQDYVKYRPTYPTAAIATLLEEFPTSCQCSVADIGAGTGISARLLANQGLQVWAIEPNPAMREAAELHPAITWLSGTAEQTGLPDASVDLVTCFQSFHWFNPSQCLPEFRRIVKPKGRLAVVWNTRDRTDPLTASYSTIVQKLSQNHPAESRMESTEVLKTCSEFHNLRRLEIPFRQALDLPGLIGRARSVSYIPKDELTQQQLTAELTALFQKFTQPSTVNDATQIEIAYFTQVFLAAPTSFS